MMKELIGLIILAEVLQAIYIIVLLISSSFYFRHLIKNKKQRKLSTVEYTMYIIIQIAYVFFGISILIYTFVK
ncbi:hypothetical protein AM499_05075 [Bacillus sp. FJAT-22090]|nr:hypothetical protein AM499_05075 [Bacillus sp. FJAT-22090]